LIGNTSGAEKCFINSTGLAVLMDLLLPIKERQITRVHPKAHFRRVFEITGWRETLKWWKPDYDITVEC
jgi:hypothetical protein